MSKRILILDGDSIAYRCAAAGEERSIKVTHQPTGISKSFKHRTEFKQAMLEKGKEITSDYSIEDVQEPEPIAYVCNTIKNHIERIADEVKPDRIEIFAGEQFNFRLDLPLPKQYKGQRKDTLRPVHLKDAKRYLHNKFDAKEAVGYEVDDAQTICAYSELSAGNEPIMYFYEKDQFQMDGITLLFDNAEFEYKVVPSLGELHLEKSSVKGLGLKFLAYQWICSDPVDHYCAYDLSTVRFGPKAAYNALVDCKSEKEVLEVVIEQFKKFYPTAFEYKDWRGDDQTSDSTGMMQLYYKACRMMRSEDDQLDCMDLFNKHGVQL